MERSPARRSAAKSLLVKIKRLSQQALKGKRNLNNLPDLLDIAKSANDEDVVRAAIVACCDVIVHHVRDGFIPAKRTTVSEEERIAQNWFSSQISECNSFFISLVGKGSFELHMTATTAFLKVWSELISRPSTRDIDSFSGFFVRVYGASEDKIDWFQAQYMGIYRDVLYRVIVELTNTFLHAKTDPDSDPLDPDHAYMWIQRVVESKLNIQTISESVHQYDDDDDDDDDDGVDDDDSKISGSHNDGARFVPNPPASWTRPSSFGKKYSKLWENFLGCIEPSATTHLQVLRTIEAHLLRTERLRNPIWLMDYFERACAGGGLGGLIALSGMFTLVTRHNFPDARYYPRLYDLVQPWVLHTVHRVRFFVLLDASLSSTHIPINAAAAFVKRLARLCLSAPPHGILPAMGICYNLLLRFPPLRVMLHRPVVNHRSVLLLNSQRLAQSLIGDSPSTTKGKRSPEMASNTNDDARRGKKKKRKRSRSGIKRERATDTSPAPAKERGVSRPPSVSPGTDPYDADEPDFERCRALDSSLWEIETLKRHYHPVVVQRTSLFNGKYSSGPINVKDWAEISYTSEFNAEINRTAKGRAVALEYREPKGLLCLPMEEKLMQWMSKH